MLAAQQQRKHWTVMATAKQESSGGGCKKVKKKGGAAAAAAQLLLLGQRKRRRQRQRGSRRGRVKKGKDRDDSHIEGVREDDDDDMINSSSAGGVGGGGGELAGQHVPLRNNHGKRGITSPRETIRSVHSCTALTSKAVQKDLAFFGSVVQQPSRDTSGWFTTNARAWLTRSHSKGVGCAWRRSSGEACSNSRLARKSVLLNHSPLSLPAAALAAWTWACKKRVMTLCCRHVRPSARHASRSAQTSVQRWRDLTMQPVAGGN